MKLLLHIIKVCIMRIKNTFVFLAVLSIFFVIFVVGALISVPVLADANDTVTIDVNVTQAAAITVVPDTLSWTGVSTGSAASVQYLNIKNSGSINVSSIHAYIDTLESEPSRPYGSADPSDFSAYFTIEL